MSSHYSNVRVSFSQSIANEATTTTLLKREKRAGRRFWRVAGTDARATNATTGRVAVAMLPRPMVIARAESRGEFPLIRSGRGALGLHVTARHIDLRLQTHSAANAISFAPQHVCSKCSYLMAASRLH